MNRPPHSVQQGVSDLLQTHFKKDVALKSFSPIGGGCINSGGKLSTSQGDFFVKWNEAKKYAGMFAAEATGLKLLAAPNAIRIPEVVGYGEKDEYQFLVLEFIESHSRQNDYWHLLGKELAALHRSSNEKYGLDHENYIGSLPQRNKAHPSWVEFFIRERLEVQLKIGLDSHALSSSVVKRFEALYSKLPSILMEEQPSLLHGDLWNGNLITDEKGRPCLIDPAVYYGHREVDLGLTTLFGGFDQKFYDTYQEAFPLEPGFRERLDIYNLYPLLVHVNLFGQSYLHQVNGILNTFV